MNCPYCDGGSIRLGEETNLSMCVRRRFVCDGCGGVWFTTETVTEVLPPSDVPTETERPS